MNKLFLLLPLALLLFTQGFAQKQLTRTGTITFFSSTPVEDIEAVNNQVTSVINPEKGEMAFAVLMKAFQFEKALMQEHFNEKYVHSDKFPKATFAGKITDMDAVNFQEDGTYPVKVVGKLTIHGITQEVEVEGTIQVVGGNLSAEAELPIVLEDFDIKVPSVVRENIAKVIMANVQMAYKPQS
ncbi:MAG: YceI family protein [Bacteroidota bacterium]